MTPRLRALVLFTLVPAVGGCASAGFMAAGPLMAAVQMVGVRSVERTVAADLARAWDATLLSLVRSGVRVEEMSPRGETWRLGGKADQISVSVELARVTSGLTRVSIRVEDGGVLADRRTGEELLNQIARALELPVPVAARPGPGPAEESMTGLRRDVQEIRTRLDEMRPAPASAPAPPAPAAPTLSVEPGRVVTIPASVGIPSLPGDAPPVNVLAPAVRDQMAVAPGATPPPAAAEPAPTPAGDETGVSSLAPVDALRPVVSEPPARRSSP